MPISATRTARARARAELTEEILQAARVQLAEVGSAALSVRAIARQLGMASSAVYRYFPGRDELLTALIVEAYDAVGHVAEQADVSRRGTVEARWLRISRAIRGWAVAHPQQYALIYGSPVPGYKAPDDTVPPATRVSSVMLRLLADGVASGEIHVDGDPVPRSVHADLAAVREHGAPGVPDHVLSRGLAMWTEMFGTISFELFGHLHRVINDYDAFFENQMRRAARSLVAAV